MNLTKFDTNVAAEIQAAMQAALQPVAEQYGVKITAAGGTFSSVECSARFKLTVLDEAAQEAEARKVFTVACGFFGLEPRHFGTRFKLGREREEMQLVGIEPSRRKFPLKIKNVRTGQVKLFTEALVPLIKEAAKAA